MTAVEERSEIAQELYSCVQDRYRLTLERMFFLVPVARAHFEAGNVHTSFRLLREAPVQVNKEWGMTKETMLHHIMQVVPSMYQIGDLDPDFEPSM